MYNSDLPAEIDTSSLNDFFNGLAVVGIIGIVIAVVAIIVSTILFFQFIRMMGDIHDIKKMLEQWDDDGIAKPRQKLTPAPVKNTEDSSEKD